MRVAMKVACTLTVLAGTGIGSSAMGAPSWLVQILLSTLLLVAPLVWRTRRSPAVKPPHSRRLLDEADVLISLTLAIVFMFVVLQFVNVGVFHAWIAFFSWRLGTTSDPFLVGNARSIATNSAHVMAFLATSLLCLYLTYHVTVRTKVTRIPWPPLLTLAVAAGTTCLNSVVNVLVEFGGPGTIDAFVFFSDVAWLFRIASAEMPAHLLHVLTFAAGPCVIGHLAGRWFRSRRIAEARLSRLSERNIEDLIDLAADSLTTPPEAGALRSRSS